MIVKIKISILSKVDVKMVSHIRHHLLKYYFKFFKDFKLFFSQLNRLPKKTGEYGKDGYKFKERSKLTIECNPNQS